MAKKKTKKNAKQSKPVIQWAGKLLDGSGYATHARNGGSNKDATAAAIAYANKQGAPIMHAKPVRVEIREVK